VMGCWTWLQLSVCLVFHLVAVAGSLVGMYRTDPGVLPLLLCPPLCMHACTQVMASQKQMEAKYKQAQATAVSSIAQHG
jgi:hypothetical protein